MPPKKKDPPKKPKAGANAKSSAQSAPPPAPKKQWTAAIDRNDFLEIASLRRVLLSGVSVNRHVMGLVHPVSVFTSKSFDCLFWYKRHGGGVQQYNFKHLVDVIPVNSPQSVGDAFPQALVEMTRSGKYEGDLAARAFVLIFSVPISQAELAGADESLAARQGSDQQADFYRRSSRAATVTGGGDEEHVQLSVDFVCDNQWAYESLLEGFTLIRDNYSELVNSPEFGKLQEVGGVVGDVKSDGQDNMKRIESAATNTMKKLGKDEKSGKHTGATQAMNTLHQLYQPEHHPNHRAKFKVKVGTEVEIMYKPNAYECWYTKRGMEAVKVDLKANKYFKPGKYCMGVITRRYRDDTYDVTYTNGPFAMDEDPNHSMKPLFPRRGLMFKRVPKAFLIVDYDAQLASRFPYSIVTLSAVQTIYFAYYISTHSRNEQGEVSAWVGVAGDEVLYLKSMGSWPTCENLIWGDGEYWRLGSYQLVHFGLNHIGFNMLAQVLFGTPIERVHGTFRIMLLYQCGVVGASLFAGWTDPMKIVVGASGGVYTILGAHWANMAIAWDAMKNGTVPPFARMFVLSTLMGIDLFQYFFYRAGGTSYAVHLGGWLIGFVGGILILRELEVDFWETWVVRPLAVLTFVALVAYSIYWDTTHWPPVRPGWVADINFGDGTKQCCWKVWECRDYALKQDDGMNHWGPDQWDDISCSGYDLYGDYDDDGLTTCEAMYNYVFNPTDDKRIAELAALGTTGGTSVS